MNLGGVPYGLRIVKVRCDQENWLPVSKAIIEEMRQPGYSSLTFVMSPQECGDYAKTARSETAPGEVRHAIIPVHGRQSRECSDASLCLDVEDDEARTSVATDSLSASTTLFQLRCVVNPGIGKRPCHRAGMSFLSLCTLTKDENRHRHGRAGRTVPGICFQLVLPDGANAVNVDQDVLVEESAEQWLLAAVQLSYSLRKPLFSFRR